MNGGKSDDGVNRRSFIKASAAATTGAVGLASIGETKPETERESMEPFTIDVPDRVLIDLRDRLKRTRFPDQLENAGWGCGADLAYVKDLCAYWRSKFDWRAQERALNRFHHSFKVPNRNRWAAV